MMTRHRAQAKETMVLFGSVKGATTTVGSTAGVIYPMKSNDYHPLFGGCGQRFLLSRYWVTLGGEWK